MFYTTSLFILLWQCCEISTSLAQKCYLPDGTEAPRDTPCGPTSSNQASACCFPEDTCLSNRLCLNANLLTNRGSCTDQTWHSEGCAPWCQDVNPHDGIRIVNVKDGLFCCGSGYFDSSSGTCVNSTRGSNAPFALDQGYVIFNRSSGSTSPNSTATVTSTVTLAGATVESVTTTATIAAGTAALRSPISDRGSTVGVAVGVPLGIGIMGCVGMLLRQRREAGRLREEKRDWEARYDALLKSKTETLRSEEIPYSRQRRYQLEDATIGEFAEDTMIRELDG